MHHHRGLIRVSDKPAIVPYMKCTGQDCFRPIRESRNNEVDTEKIIPFDKDQDNVVTKKLVEKCLPGLIETVWEQYLDNSVLFFWTQSACFTVQRNQNLEGNLRSSAIYVEPDPAVFDAHGNAVGSICKMHTNHWKSLAESYLSEFIFIATRQISGMPEDLCPPQALVLEIKRDKNGVCHRINVGKVNQKAWEEAKPEKILVALA